MAETTLDTPEPAPARAIAALERATALDPAVGVLGRITPTWLRSGEGRRILGGAWLGHALHPVLTDLPIGSWTSAWVLDLVGGESARPAATLLVGVGVVTAIPTIAAGWSDWTTASERQQRVGVVHAVANSLALAFYSASWVLRVRDRNRAGVLVGMLGATAATAGGMLGGHLTLARGVGARPAS